MNKSDENTTAMLIPVSIGELMDKISILEIKMAHMKDQKLKNVEKELKYLRKVVEENLLDIDIKLINELKNVNKALWDIEDKIRLKESQEKFDSDFIQLARSVYIQNDKRSNIKKEINCIYNSELTEEKSYY
tara:strand:+ start:483 stop:878 length:396 start_codon:yes stop_codon:yes gene_type:complete